MTRVKIILLLCLLLCGCSNQSLKRKEKKPCEKMTTKEYEWHCDGWWHTFTHNNKIYNCLPQIDFGELYKKDICYNGKRYVCHVNSNDITQEKIDKSCKRNKEVEENCAGQFVVPKRMDHQ